MRLFFRHASILKQVSASTSNPSRLPLASPGHWLHVSAAPGASENDGDQSANGDEGRDDAEVTI